MKGKQTARNKAGKILTCTAGKTYPCGKSCFSLDRLCFQKGGYQARKKALQLAEYLKSTFLDKESENNANETNGANEINGNNQLKYKNELALPLISNAIQDLTLNDSSVLKEIKDSYDSIFKEMQETFNRVGTIISQEEYDNYYNQIKSTYQKMADIREKMKSVDLSKISTDEEFRVATFLNNIPVLPLPGYKLQMANLEKVKAVIGENPC